MQEYRTLICPALLLFRRIFIDLCFHPVKTGQVKEQRAEVDSRPTSIDCMSSNSSAADIGCVHAAGCDVTCVGVDQVVPVRRPLFDIAEDIWTSRALIF